MKILKVEVRVLSYVVVSDDYDLDLDYPLVYHALVRALKNKAGLSFAITQHMESVDLPLTKLEGNDSTG